MAMPATPKINRRYFTGTALVVGATILFSTSAVEAVPTNEEAKRISDGINRQQALRIPAIQKLPKLGGRTVIRANMPRKRTSLNSLKLSVDGFKLEGHPGVDATAVDEVIAPWKGRELTFGEFEQMVHAVAAFLRENGHPDAQVMISRANIKKRKMAVAVRGLTPASVFLAKQKPIDVEPRLFVERFEVQGLTLLDEEELTVALEPFSGRYLSGTEMQNAAEAVANVLRGKGYKVAQAFLPPQRADDGILKIEVLEGVVDPASGVNGIVVTGAGKRLRKAFIESHIATAVKGGEPLHVPDLDKSIRLAKLRPGVKSINADLAPGSTPGTTQVNIKVEEENLFSGTVSYDNYGSAYVGSHVGRGTLNINSPMGFGERFSYSYNRSDDMTIHQGSFSVPVGSRGSLEAAYSAINMGIGQDLSILDLTSSSRTWSLDGRYAVMAEERDSLFANLSLQSKQMWNDMGTYKLNHRKVDVATLGLEASHLTDSGNQVNWGLSASVGNVDLSKNASNQANDAITARTEDIFGKFNLTYDHSALVTGTENWSIRGKLQAQLATKNLDSAEKMSLGGPTGVRAYPVGEASGDHGVIGSFEVHRNMGKYYAWETGLYAFLDAGHIVQNADLWSTALDAGDRNEYSLYGYGLGATANYADVGGFNLMVAKKIGLNPGLDSDGTDADNKNLDPRLWIIGDVKF
ncbi:ShlB/FhaC/HecB family hemolysin secretion/activation protein [Magnetococcus sp. PR-3]|uniref:ShlB/FhaC/HecB family hemolysin secretion/activation protein n=1 Tax=Magnetococcus sp. PR-3 TaxID=3120355 RepID=UPI002FCDEA2B